MREAISERQKRCQPKTQVKQEPGDHAKKKPEEEKEQLPGQLN